MKLYPTIIAPRYLAANSMCNFHDSMEFMVILKLGGFSLYYPIPLLSLKLRTHSSYNIKLKQTSLSQEKMFFSSSGFIQQLLYLHMILEVVSLHTQSTLGWEILSSKSANLSIYFEYFLQVTQITWIQHAETAVMKS